MTRNAERSPARTKLSPPTRNDADPPAARPWWRQPYPWLVVLGGLVVFNLIYALPRYLSLDPANSRSALNTDAPAHFPLLVAHVVTGNIAMVTVFLQLWPWLRRNHPAVHRLSGRVYVFGGVLPSAGLALFALIPLRPDQSGSVGLATMGTLWLVTTLVGLWMVRHQRYSEHRRWMVYSFALAMGTSWGRLILIAFTLFPTLPMSVGVLVETTSWLGWIVNLVVAHWWLETRATRVSKGGGELVSYPSPVSR